MARDYHHKLIECGDTVKCIHDDYSTIDYGDRLEVVATDTSCISFEDCYKDGNLLRYLARNFIIVRKAKKAKPMSKAKAPETGIFMALLIEPNLTKDEAIEDILTTPSKLRYMMESTMDRLMERIQMSISKDPSKKWLIVNTNQTVETAPKPMLVKDW